MDEAAGILKWGARQARRIGVGLLVWSALGMFGVSSSWALSGSAYVANLSSGTVSQYKIGAGEALAPQSPPTVDTGSSSSPFALAATPDGATVYLADFSGSIDQFTVGADGSLSPKMPASVPDDNSPWNIAVSPDGKSAYVANNSTDGPDGVSQFDIAADGTLTPKTPATVAAGDFPWAVVLSPDGKSAYVSNSGIATVSQYDVAADGTLTPKSPATVDIGSGAASQPNELAISPDGKSVYVVAAGDSAVAQFDVGTGGRLSPKSPAEVTTGTGTDPEGIVVSPDGNSVYVGDFGTGTISQFDVGADGALSPKSPATVSSGGNTPTLWMTPDGKSLYAGNYDGGSGATVSQFDVSAGGLLSAKSSPTVSTGDGPHGVLVLPEQGPVASFTATVGAAGSATFDGSGSSDPDGTVARYEWNFGDGTASSSTGSMATHTYASAGNYTVTLTVTDEVGCSTAQVFTGHTVYCNGSAAATTTRIVMVSSPSAPPPPAPPPVATKFVLTGAPRPSSRGVSFSLACHGATGVVCRGAAQLTTLEHLRGRRIVALSARRKRHTKRITIGSKRFTVAAGGQRKIMVGLNGRGRKLLARFRHVHATLTITLLNAKPPTVIKRKTTINAKPKKRKHRHAAHLRAQFGSTTAARVYAAARAASR
jgi:DNA-binding beta-propeller fold protein YncE